MGSILNLLFPVVCVGCKKEGKYICDTCLIRVPRARSHCIICKNYSYNFQTHPSCLTKIAPNQAISIYAHRGVVRTAIHKIKYNFNYDIAKEIVNIITNNIVDYKLDQNVVIIPIPLSKKREKWRGFNQSYLLGRLLALQNNWYLDNNLLFKRESHTQVGLNKSERIINLKNKFYLNQNFKPNNKLTYLIFDDVTTTGATMLEATKVLKKKGVKKVVCLTICLS